VEDGFYRRLLDQRGGHIEQGSISVMGGRQSPVVFRHVHQTSTEQLNRKPIAAPSQTDTNHRFTCTNRCLLQPRSDSEEEAIHLDKNAQS
jgi:hypothetical protein